MPPSPIYFHAEGRQRDSQRVQTSRSTWKVDVVPLHTPWSLWQILSIVLPAGTTAAHRICSGCVQCSHTGVHLIHTLAIRKTKTATTAKKKHYHFTLKRWWNGKQRPIKLKAISSSLTPVANAFFCLPSLIDCQSPSLTDGPSHSVNDCESRTPKAELFPNTLWPTWINQYCSHIIDRSTCQCTIRPVNSSLSLLLLLY